MLYEYEILKKFITTNLDFLRENYDFELKLKKEIQKFDFKVQFYQLQSNIIVEQKSEKEF